MRVFILFLMIFLDISLITMHSDSLIMVFVTICFLVISALIVFMITAFDEDISRMQDKDD